MGAGVAGLLLTGHVWCRGELDHRHTPLTPPGLAPHPRLCLPQGRSCTQVSKRVIYCDAASGGQVHHVELSMDRGVPWDTAQAFK